uniref:hypothetical protein n=1 Tax=uncultured Bradyrhizobium sp. TaxID=199684 RepID=UPI0034591621
RLGLMPTNNKGTVKNLVSALLRKLDARDRTALALTLYKALGVMSRDVVLAPARNDTVPIQEVSVQTACH